MNMFNISYALDGNIFNREISFSLSLIFPVLTFSPKPPTQNPAPQLQSHSSTGLWTLLGFENRESPRLLL